MANLLEYEKQIEHQDSGTKPFFREIYTLLKDSAKTYIKPRQGRIRRYIVLSGLVYLVFMSVEFALKTTIASYYMFRIGFSPSELGYFKAIQAVLGIVAQILLVFGGKRIMLLSDTTIVLIGIASLTAEMVLLGVATNKLMVYISAVAGVFNGLATPTMKSVVAQLVEPNEVGKAFIVFGIAADIAFISGLAVYNNVYAATVDWMPGFVFLFVALLSLCCFLCYLYVHIGLIKDRNAKLSIQ